MFRTRGFSGSDAFQTIAALKFLGIIDKDGNKTDRMNKLQLKGEEHTQAILEIVKSAYKKLFDTVEEANKLDKDDLFNDFISVYGLSGRLATTAVPNFLWLAKQAGLEVSDAPELKERKNRAKNLNPIQRLSEKQDVGAVLPPETSSLDSSVEVGEFKLIIPSDWDQDETRKAIVKGEFTVIYEELEKLSIKLKKQHDTSQGEVA